MSTYHFYQVIIGTEILLGRRKDKHFDFLLQALLERGENLYASFVIGDDATLIEEIFALVAKDPKGVMFSFGGIGSTPDDLTRAVAAKVFTHKPLTLHEEAKHRILDRFGEEAYPHRIHMAELPEGAELLDNPVNNVPGFSLQNRYFFTPGFPQMAHPMVIQAIDRLLPERKKRCTETFTALTSENDLIDMMQQLPPTITLSSLPAFCGQRRIAVISLSAEACDDVKTWRRQFEAYMKEKGIAWVEGDRHDDPDLCHDHA